MSNRIDSCPHVAIVRARHAKPNGKETLQPFSDKEVVSYVCMHCGFPLLAAPVSKFKNNPEAYAFFEKIQKEYVLSLPSVKPRMPQGQPEDCTIQN